MKSENSIKLLVKMKKDIVTKSYEVKEINNQIINNQQKDISKNNIF